MVNGKFHVLSIDRKKAQKPKANPKQKTEMGRTKKRRRKGPQGAGSNSLKPQEVEVNS